MNITYLQYSTLANRETESEESIYQELITELYMLNDENEVKQMLKSKWGLRDDIRNFPISSEILLSTRTRNNNFNLTVAFKDEIKSYNFQR